MAIIVQKFGGSSVATVEKLNQVAEHIIYEKDKGNQVVVVVSAQGKTTDKLISEEAEITTKPSPREHDVLVSVGEQITISKLSMVLQTKGYRATSLTGWQIPIITNNEHNNSRIRYIKNETILDYLRGGNIVIVAGFQGIDELGNITTLGRGGSDTTAVALAASLNAERCDIYTDVDGVFTADPRIVPDARKLDLVSYDEMLELASMGAKVLHNRCVEIGNKYSIPIFVKSTFLQNSQGTMITHSNKQIESLTINGVAKDDYITRITVVGISNKIGQTYKLFKVMADNLINIDVIVQAFGETVKQNVAFTVKMTQLEKTLKVLEEHKEELNIEQVIHTDNLSKVSIIGIGINNKPGVAADMFEALYKENINMHMVSTSEVKISVLVDVDDADRAVRAIHKKFFK